jgi:hypothetical protein
VSLPWNTGDPGILVAYPGDISCQNLKKSQVPQYQSVTLEKNIEKLRENRRKKRGK